jgi:hypothetical protein
MSAESNSQPQGADPGQPAAGLAMRVCRLLDGFQKEYEHNTRGCKMPGNDLYGDKLMAIVEEARAALSAPAQGPAGLLDAAGMVACPFCGQRGAVNSLPHYRVGCWNAKCAAFVNGNQYLTEDAAVAAWNRRHPVPAAPAAPVVDDGKPWIPPKLGCELCKGTGFYGDNGPGRKGNSEYIHCECTVPAPHPGSASTGPTECLDCLASVPSKYGRLCDTHYMEAKERAVREEGKEGAGLDPELVKMGCAYLSALNLIGQLRKLAVSDGRYWDRFGACIFCSNHMDKGHVEGCLIVESQKALLRYDDERRNVSASTSFQRAASGPIRVAVAKQILWFFQDQQAYPGGALEEWDADTQAQMLQYADRVLALLGEAPPTKEAEQDPDCYCKGNPLIFCLKCRPEPTVTPELPTGQPQAQAELYPKPDHANLAHSLAEFYYLHAYDQNRGVGLTAAHDFLDTHLAGKWLSKLVQPPQKEGDQ